MAKRLGVLSLLAAAVKLLQTFAVSGKMITQYERWTAPLTTYPLATPFLVTGSGGALQGAGITFHHIHLMCGNDGSKPSAVFLWTTLR